MKYQRTQILLAPEEHRRLVREAAERGMSLSAYLREVLAARAGEAPAPYDQRSWDGIFDLVSAGGASSEQEPDEEARAAFTEAVDRDVDRPGPSREAKKRTRKR